MSRRRALLPFSVDRARADRLEQVARAWQAYYWEAASGGVFVPSAEDRALFESLIGPPPLPVRRL